MTSQLEITDERKDVAFRLSESLPGWLSRTEAETLHRYASSIPSSRHIVEIGAYRGKSTVILAATNHYVATVDPMRPGDYPDNDMVITETDVEELTNLIDSLPNVQWIRMPSDSVDFSHREIGLLYIDGNHTWPDPILDFLIHAPHMPIGSVVIFHDYDDKHPDVIRSVKRLLFHNYIKIVEISDRMLVARMQRNDIDMSLEGTEPVTGINIVFLCDHFARRVKPFIRSLIEQQGVNRRFVFSAYYSRDEERDAIVSALDQESSQPWVCQYRKVPDNLKMRRARLFANHNVPSYECSHVLFTDCDLWFPKTFFKRYLFAAALKPRGYWGAWISNISYPESEVFVNNWTDPQYMSESVLRVYADSEFRHGHAMGRAGHFQFVPNALAKYPDNNRLGVAITDDVFANWAIRRSESSQADRRIGACRAYHFDHPNVWEGTTLEL